MGRIEAMGRQLNDAYCETIGQEKAAIGMPALVQTPMEFRSVLVTLDPADRARIRKGILQQSQLNGNQTTQRQEGNIFGR